MKQLTCEMCGSNDLIKQDGVFVCQSCGCKYSVEEAKKMMVEGTVEVTGTVKIDDSSELTNLKQLATNAKNRKDYKEAAKYYNELLLKEPNSWEANYYTVYAQAMDIKVGEIPNEITRVSNNIPTVFSLINKSNYTSFEKVDIIKEIGKSFFELTILFFENYKMEGSSGTRIKILEAQEDFYMQICNYFSDDKEFMDAYGINLLSSKLDGVYVFEEEILSKENHLYYTYDCKNVYRRSQFVQGTMERANACCRKAMENYKSDGHNELSNEESQERKYFKMQIVDMFTITGKGTLITGKVESGKINVNEKIYINNKMYTVAGIESNRQIINSASEGMNIGILIKGKTTKEFEKGSIVTNRIDSISSETHINNSSLENTTDKQSKGCYVATCVYGTYDCPQVWTLRRFRDNTLAENLLGRAFIRTYYAISPTLVRWFGDTSWFKKMWKGALDRMVSKLRANGVEDTPYQDRNW